MCKTLTLGRGFSRCWEAEEELLGWPSREALGFKERQVVQSLPQECYNLSISPLLLVGAGQPHNSSGSCIVRRADISPTFLSLLFVQLAPGTACTASSSAQERTSLPDFHITGPLHLLWGSGLLKDLFLCHLTTWQPPSLQETLPFPLTPHPTCPPAHWSLLTPGSGLLSSGSSALPCLGSCPAFCSPFLSFIL